MKAIIFNNLRISISSFHMRFEDLGVAMPGKGFSFGVIIDKILYSNTNSRFERVFLSDDHMKTASEQGRSFQMLEIVQVALYWTWLQNPHDMWSSSPYYLDLDTSAAIEFSKKFVET